MTPPQAEPPGSTGQRVSGVAAATWCALFALPHVYWALGGRRGLGEDAVEADHAFDQVWFAAYNAAVILACVVGFGVAIAAALVRTLLASGRRRRVATAIFRLAAAVLLARGAIGMIGSAWATVRGEPLPPPGLLWVEPAFLVGGLLWWRLARALAAGHPQRTTGSGGPV